MTTIKIETTLVTGRDGECFRIAIYGDTLLVKKKTAKKIHNFTTADDFNASDVEVYLNLFSEFRGYSIQNLNALTNLRKNVDIFNEVYLTGSDFDVIDGLIIALLRGKKIKELSLSSNHVVIDGVKKEIPPSESFFNYHDLFIDNINHTTV